MKTTVIVNVVTLLFLVDWTCAQSVPPTINYQGQLVNGIGKPLATADYELTFSIWDAAQGGTEKWGPQIFDGQGGPGFGPMIPVVQGHFNVVLGPIDTVGRALAGALLSGANYYLETKVGDKTISPRQQILSTPFALRSETAANLAGHDWGLIFVDGSNPQASKIKNGLLPSGVVYEGNLHHLNASDGAPANAVSVDAQGRVGIGTTSPRQLLHLRAAPGPGGTKPAFVQVEDSDGKAVVLGSDSTGGSLQSSSNIRFVAGATSSMTITTAGKIGIGTDAPDAKLDVVQTSDQVVALKANNTGSGNYFHAGGNWYGAYAFGNQYDFMAGGPGVDYGSASSLRWKENVHSVDEPLEKLERLHGVYFRWDAAHGGRQDIGMIAEEVGAVLPEIVAYETNGVDAVAMDYSKLTPLLVEAVKTLRSRSEERQAELEQRLRQQATSIESLEQQNQVLIRRARDVEQRLAAVEKLIETRTFIQVQMHTREIESAQANQ